MPAEKAQRLPSVRMRTPSAHLAAATVVVLITVTGCEPKPTGSGVSPTPEPTSALASEVAPMATETTAAPTPSASPAAAALAASATATGAVTSAWIRYTTQGFDSLTATAWAADVTLSPPTAKGTGELLVDGVRAPTGFDVNGGRLRVENADGTREDVGEAFGVLDPPRILDPKTGLPVLLSTATGAEADPGTEDVEGTPMLRIRAQLPITAGAILIPAAAITETGPLPVTLWLDPASNILRQLILTTSGGSVSLRLNPTPS